MNGTPTAPASRNDNVEGFCPDARRIDYEMACVVPSRSIPNSPPEPQTSLPTRSAGPSTTIPL